MPNVDREFDEAIRYNKPISNTQQKPQNVNLEDSFLQIFNSPEYKQRQAELRRREQEEYNKKQIKETQTRRSGVSNINTKAFKRKKKFTLHKGIPVIIVIVVAGFLAKAFITNIPNQPEQEYYIPDGYVSMYTSERVDRGDTVYSIADEYYDADTYSHAYGSLHDYVENIIDTNNLSYDGDIQPADVLTIPVLVDIDNEHYQNLTRLEQEISKITKEEYWIDYVVQPGDSLSGIAAKASGSNGETIELTKKIMAKNGLDSSLIYSGQHLKIINPILGQLKAQFNEAKTELRDSLKDDNNNLTR